MAAKTQPKTMTVNVRDVDWTIDPDVLDDWELLERLNSNVQADQMFAMSEILGKPQLNAAKELVRDSETGRVPASEMLALLIEIFTGMGEAGNS